MGFSKTYSAQTNHLASHTVDVEVDISLGLHSFSIVGLPDKAVEEAKDRISAAIKNSGFRSPKQQNHKITVSLAPADIKKAGPHFDLSIAIGYLLAAGEIAFDPVQKLFLGELSLDGRVRKIQGCIGPILEAKLRGFKEIFIPAENIKETQMIDGVHIYGVHSLNHLIDHLTKRSLINRNSHKQNSQTTDKESAPDVDFKNILFQETAKRALIISAVGRHNILLYGPPGTGKTMLAKAFHSILPPLTPENVLEVAAIHSTSYLNHEPSATPPFRTPHHTASYTAIFGGSRGVGEMSLAHRGVLLLDEFPEFDRRVIEGLRQPLEDKIIHLSRAHIKTTLPADCILIATMNPCPCGHHGSNKTICTCTSGSMEKYKKRISPPIIDRIDLHVHVASIEWKDGMPQPAEGTVEIRKRIADALLFKRKRSQDSDNSESLTASAQETLLNSAAALHLSARSVTKIRAVARTIADLDQSTSVEDRHILEALQYRQK